MQKIVVMDEILANKIAAGEIIGWDLWQLLPGGEDQGYQFATATLYNNAEKMFEDSNLWQRAKEAYPNMSEEAINEKMNEVILDYPPIKLT